jgi:TPR repeat protein
MNKLATRIFALSCLWVLGVQANSTGTTSGPNGYTKIKSELKLIDPKRVQKQSIASVQSQHEPQCSSAELVGLDQAQFIAYIRDNSKDCLRFLFESANNEQIYDKNRVLAVVNASDTEIASFDGTRDISNFFMYMRAMYYVQFYHNNGLTIDGDMKAAIAGAISRVPSIPGILTNDSDANGALMYEWISAADATDAWSQYHNTVVNFVSNITEEKAARYFNQAAYNSALMFFYRGQSNNHDVYGANVIGKDTNLPDVLTKVILNPTLRRDAEYISDNAVNELVRLFQWPDVAEPQHNAVQRVIDANERLTKQWMMVVTGIDTYGADCTKFTGDVCATDALRQEILALAFPHEYEFDSGAMRFHTSLSRKEVEQLYYQLKETQATFFKVTGATEPVAGDTNDVAIFRIYGTKQEYTMYQPFLYDLSSNNGGIYIERDSTLYTYDREPWESTFTLEELARHEYVHYLNSRYLIPGFFGDTEMYSSERLTWFDEGMANFIAGGTQDSGIHPLHTMLNMVEARTVHYTPDQAVHVKYGDPYMYPYAALLLNYMYDNKSPLIQELVDALRADDVLTYDNIRNQIADLSTSGFNTYIANALANSGSYNAPWKTYPTESTLQLTDAANVQTELMAELGSTLSNLQCTNLSDLQFSCEGTLTYAVTDTVNPLFELYPQMDSIAAKLTGSDTANLRTANVFETNVTIDTHTVQIVGGLRRASTPFKENHAPMATDSETTVAVGASVSGQMTATDSDGDTLKYSLIESPLTGNLVWHEDGSYTYNADDESFQGVITFTFKANDGLLDSNMATVSIKVGQVVVEPVNNAPVATGSSISVQEGSSVSGNMSATDADGDALTFSPTTPAHGSLSYDKNTGTFTYTPTTGFTGTDSFSFTVTDGSVESNTATITITVTAKPSTGGGNGGGDSTNSASGGAVGIFGLLMMAIAAFRRIKMKRPVFLILTMVLTLQGCSQPTELEAECSKLAAYPYDPTLKGKNRGVADEDIQPNANEICARALQEQPKNGRIMTQLARTYLAKKDFTKGKELLFEAADALDPSALTILGSSFSYSNDDLAIEKDESKAIEYFNKALELGVKEAGTELATIYLHSKQHENIELGKESLIKAAKSGEKYAQFNLSTFYYLGDLFEKDEKESIYWLKKSADNNFPEALVALASEYKYGGSIDKDLEMSFKYYAMAAEQNHPEGILGLGAAYLHGLGVPEDANKGRSLIKKAATLGSEDAMKLLMMMWQDTANSLDLAKSESLVCEDKDSKDPYSTEIIFDRGNRVAEVNQIRKNASCHAKGICPIRGEIFLALKMNNTQPGSNDLEFYRKNSENDPEKRIYFYPATMTLSRLDGKGNTIISSCKEIPTPTAPQLEERETTRANNLANDITSEADLEGFCMGFSEIAGLALTSKIDNQKSNYASLAMRSDESAEKYGSEIFKDWSRKYSADQIYKISFNLTEEQARQAYASSNYNFVNLVSGFNSMCKQDVTQSMDKSWNVVIKPKDEVQRYAEQLLAGMKAGGACQTLKHQIKSIADSPEPSNVREIKIDRIIDIAAKYHCLSGS